MRATRASRTIRRGPTMSRTRVAAVLSERRIIGPSSERSSLEIALSWRMRSNETSSITLIALAVGAVLAR
jgi:hypothetical protein